MKAQDEMMRSLRSAALCAAVVLAASCAPATEIERPPAPDTRPDVEAPPVRPPPPATTPALLGAVLPRTGSPALVQFGDLVLEGVRIAAADHERATGQAVEIVLVDDGGTAGGASRAIAQLQARGVVGVVGPLLDEAVAAAATARGDQRLALISPTATERPVAANSYALNAPDAEGAVALARYAVRSGYRRVAILHPIMAESNAQALQFRQALEAAGGTVVVDVAYPVGTTTFADQVRRVRAANPQAIFIPAPEREIRQLAPQLDFYGASQIPVLGGEAWASEDILRELPARQTDGVVAAIPLLRSSRDVAWGEFVGRYEATHRRTLDNPYPALGYDAARLILAGVSPTRPQAAEVTAALSALQEHRGATGILSVSEGRLVRRSFLVRIQGGRLMPVMEGSR
jgi:branched-chain amino acid transport system substrate-binding protein